MKRTAGKTGIRPIRILPLGFLALILLGTALLLLPISVRSGPGLTFLEALFTATSAACVTGLTVAETGVRFSFFGQAVILFLIQIGGLGFMTFAAMLFSLSNRRVSLYERMTLAESLGESRLDNGRGIAKQALLVTLLFEVAGALLLCFRFIPLKGFFQGLWFSVFHSVSAFCNAGFDLIGDGNSLMSRVGDPLLNGVLPLLIVAGGLGFPVITDIARCVRHKRRLRFSSRVVLFMSAGAIAGGALLIGLLEWSNPQTLGALSGGNRLLAAFFQSVTLRTAGFATVNQASLRESSKFISILLMLLGGSPAGTAGGLKTTSFFVLFAVIASVIKGRRQVRAGAHGVGEEMVNRVVALVSLALGVLFAGTLLVCVFEQGSGLNFLDVLFELTSAMCTVGLSVGVTAAVGSASRVVIILLMFIGRVGFITLAAALAGGGKQSLLRYPPEELPIG